MDMRFILFRSFRASKQTNWNEDDTITAPTATAISQNKVRSNDRSLDQFRPAKFQFYAYNIFCIYKIRAMRIHYKYLYCQCNGML